MSNLSSAQEMFLRSSIQQALAKSGGQWSLTVERTTDRQPLFHATGEPENALAASVNHHQNQHYPLSTDEIIQAVLNHLQEEDNRLLINDGSQTVSMQMRNGKVIRESMEVESADVKNPQWSIGKATHLNPKQAAPLLQAIGLMTPEGEIKAPMRRKFKQVNHFLDLLAPILKGSKVKGIQESKSFSLVDCGCGKSYLGFVLYWYLRKVLKKDAAFYGVDVSPKLIEQGKERAQKMGLPDMQFECDRILHGRLPRRIDLLVSLHACDTATDEAIACGIARQARNIVVVPCCQHEIADQLDGIPFYPLKKHGIFTQRFGDLLTDMMRALFLEAHGYTVTAGEFVSADETPKNLMIRASLGNPNQEKRAQEYQAFKERYNIQPSIDFFIQELEAQTES